MARMPVDNMLTREELDALPDDRLRHELIDGAFGMTPAPGVGHQSMVAELYLDLRAACEDTDLKVLFAPVDVILGSSVVERDLLVAPASAFTERDLPGAPLLVVEPVPPPRRGSTRAVRGPCTRSTEWLITGWPTPASHR